VVVYRAAPPEDLVEHLVLAELLSERRRVAARDWLRHLGPLVVPQVAGRLERAGYYRLLPRSRLRLVGSWLLMREPRWVPMVSSAYTSATAVHLSNLLDRGEPVEPQALTLLALCYACGLSRLVFPFAPAGAEEWVMRQASLLGAGLPELFDEVRHVVGTSIAAGRH
jgi:hypothetical protein